MPTQLQFAQQFIPVVEESLKKVARTGFLYFTRKDSYYEVPSTSVSFAELPSLPKAPSQPASNEEVKHLRNFAITFGQPVRQNTVRGMSTLYKAGTLPLSAYGDHGNAAPIQNLPLDAVIHQPQPNEDATEPAVVETDTQYVARKHDLFVENSLKLNDIDMGEYANINGTFAIFRCKTDVTDREEIARVEVFMEDSASPLSFCKECSVDVPIAYLSTKMPEQVTYKRGKCINLDDEPFSSILSLLHVIVSGEKEEEQSCTSTRRGRKIRLPARYRCN